MLLIIFSDFVIKILFIVAHVDVSPASPICSLGALLREDNPQKLTLTLGDD